MGQSILAQILFLHLLFISIRETQTIKLYGIPGFPRAAGALLIGAALAVSGALMQGITRNYLASPSIMGVSDGSAFIITLCMVLLPQSSSIEMMIYSFIGSALGAVLVFGLAAMMPNGFTPVQLAIIGTVTSMLLSSLSAAMSIYFQISQDLSFWYSARLHQMSPDFLSLPLRFSWLAL